MSKKYMILNNKVNIKDSNGNYLYLHLDKEATKDYFLKEVKRCTTKIKEHKIVDESLYTGWKLHLCLLRSCTSYKEFLEDPEVLQELEGI